MGYRSVIHDSNTRVVTILLAQGRHNIDFALTVAAHVLLGAARKSAVVTNVTNVLLNERKVLVANRSSSATLQGGLLALPFLVAHQAHGYLTRP